MSAVIIDIAEAVKAQLNAGTFSPAFVATREYVPQFELRDTKTLRVTVVPAGAVITAHDRTSNRFDHTIEIGVMRKFERGDAAEIDPLVAVCEAIIDALRQKRLDSYPAARCTGVSYQVLYSHEHWEQFRQFTSVMAFTYMVTK